MMKDCPKRCPYRETRHEFSRMFNLKIEPKGEEKYEADIMSALWHVKEDKDDRRSEAV